MLTAGFMPVDPAVIKGNAQGSQWMSEPASNSLPVVLVPGLTCTARLYADQIPALWQFGPVTVADHRRDDSMATIARRILTAAPPTFALAGLSMGGFIAFETPDGSNLIYSERAEQAGAPLRRVPIAGGASRQLVQCMYGFSVNSFGIYYYPCRSTIAVLPLTRFNVSEVRVIDWATSADRSVRTLDSIEYGELFWGPQVSSDGTTFLYGKVLTPGEDLMLIENFR